MRSENPLEFQPFERAAAASGRAVSLREIPVKRAKYCLAWVLASLALGACGAGVVEKTAGPPPSLGGIWKGELVDPSGVTLPAFMLITEDGRFFSVAETSDNCSEVAQGALALKGNAYKGSGSFGVIGATGALGVQLDCAFADGSVWGTASLSGSVTTGIDLSFTAADTTSLGTELQSTTGTLFFDAAYNEASSLSKVAGNWLLTTGAVLSIDANGSLFSQDIVNGCVVNGKVSLINASYNAYAVSATYSSCQAGTSALNDLTATGLMTLDDTQIPNVLYVGYSMTLPGGEMLTIVSNSTGG
jgi:hypothetical protein